MIFPRGETIADGYDVVNSGRTPRPAQGRRDWRSRHVCKVLVPSATPGALSTLCQNEPVNELGFCAEHLPK